MVKWMDGNWFHTKGFCCVSGENGLEGSGDIYRPMNLAKFSEFVSNSTDGKGVHFVVASGVSEFNL